MLISADFVFNVFSRLCHIFYFSLDRKFLMKNFKIKLQLHKFKKICLTVRIVVCFGILLFEFVYFTFRGIIHLTRKKIFFKKENMMQFT